MKIMYPPRYDHNAFMSADALGNMTCSDILHIILTIPVVTIISFRQDLSTFYGMHHLWPFTLCSLANLLSVLWFICIINVFFNISSFLTYKFFAENMILIHWDPAVGTKLSLNCLEQLMRLVVAMATVEWKV